MDAYVKLFALLMLYDNKLVLVQHHRVMTFYQVLKLFEVGRRYKIACITIIHRPLMI